MVDDLYTYEGYQLDIPSYELSDYDTKLLDTVILMIQYHWSLRETSRNCGGHKTQLHKNIHTRLRKISFELYKCCIRVMRENKSKYF